MVLPSDSHVHTAWSWDAPEGSMRASCERAIELGLPAIAFTEHVDHTVWRLAVDGAALDDHLVGLADEGQLHPPPFDAVGYLQELQECRDRYPGLRILSGLELGEPHRHPQAVADVLRAGTFDRVLGSLHSLPEDAGYAEPAGLYQHRRPDDVLREYLGEVAALVGSDQRFEVLAHIDYPVRSWPVSEPGFDPLHFEDEFRHALRVTADSGRALEVNTRVPLHAVLLQWWRDEGGSAITFGSDAHDPASIARGFRDAVHLAEAHGFRPGPSPHEPWARADSWTVTS